MVDARQSLAHARFWRSFSSRRSIFLVQDSYGKSSIPSYLIDGSGLTSRPFAQLTSTSDGDINYGAQMHGPQQTLGCLVRCLAGLEAVIQQSGEWRRRLRLVRYRRLLHKFAELHGQDALSQLEKIHLQRSERQRQLIQRRIIINEEKGLTNPPMLDGSVTRRVLIPDFGAFCDEANRLRIQGKLGSRRGL